MTRAKPHGMGLMIIAVYKLAKGTLLLIVAFGALKLMHRDVAAEAERLVNMWRVDPDNHIIHWILAKLSILDARRLRDLSVGTFVLSALTLTEGIGLALRKRWAEYFTIIMTSSFLPLEVWEIVRRETWLKFWIFALNIAIVAYLVWELRRQRKEAGEK